MDMLGVDKQMDVARNVHDLKGLDKLRVAAQSGDEKALEIAAKQFEGLFLQMLLKSMRQAQDVLADEDSPLNGGDVKFYRDMYDQQLASDLSSNGSLGLAELIVQQLGGSEQFTPASVLRSDGNLSDINRGRLQSVESIESALLSTGTDKSGKFAAFADESDFIRQLQPVAEQFAGKIGLDTKSLLAQAALETGWGQHLIHDASGQNSHNLFGIKADGRWQGNTAAIETLEYQGGLPQKTKAQFRAYDSFADSMADYVSFLSSSPRYRQALEQSNDPKAYFDSLQQAGYATDPEYAEKIQQVMDSRTFRQAFGEDASRNDGSR